MHGHAIPDDEALQTSSVLIPFSTSTNAIADWTQLETQWRGCTLVWLHLGLVHGNAH